ncbi:hypothetical protein NXX09_17275 [Bacteroides uniformis]|nr:hypothetical protein [Bacteroides uniformis]
MGNLPVVADKVYQSVAASADGPEHPEYFGFGSLIALQLFYLSGQQFSERDDGGDGVHDFMRQYADQFLPSLRFLAVQGRVYVLHAGDDELSALNGKFHT